MQTKPLQRDSSYVRPFAWIYFALTALFFILTTKATDLFEGLKLGSISFIFLCLTLLCMSICEEYKKFWKFDDQLLLDAKSDEGQNNLDVSAPKFEEVELGNRHDKLNNFNNV